MKYFAILKDSLLETLDRKSFFVLGIICLVFVLICWSISFAPLSSEDAIQKTVRRFNFIMGQPKGGMPVFRNFSGEYKATDVTEVTEGAYEDGYSFTLTVTPPSEFYKAVVFQKGLLEGTITKSTDPLPGEDPKSGNVPTPEIKDQIDYLKARLWESSFVKSRVTPQGEAVFKIEGRPYRKQSLRGGQKMSLLFGLTSFALENESAARMVYRMEYFFAEWIAGFFGVIIGLVFTASFVPSMLEKGHIELLLSRPVSRVTLLMYKYLGGLLYVFLLSIVLIGGSWLALATRSGIWNPTYLWSVGVLTLEFAILYSIAVLFGVLWRSWIGSIVMTLVGWFVSWAVNMMHSVLHIPEIMAEVSAKWIRFADMLYFVFPKTKHLGELNGLMLHQSHIGTDDEISMQLKMTLYGTTWELAILSSLGFVVVMMALACWRFTKKDY